MGTDPDMLVDLTTANSELEAETMVSGLATYGIQAKVIAVSDATLRPFTQQAIRISVRRQDLDRSVAALKELSTMPVVEDWSEVDTGDTSPLTKAELAERAAGGASTGEEGASRTTRRILAVAGVCLVAGVIFLIVRGMF